MYFLIFCRIRNHLISSASAWYLNSERWLPAYFCIKLFRKNHTLVFLLVLHRPDDILLYLHSVLPVFANVLQGDSFFDCSKWLRLSEINNLSLRVAKGQKSSSCIFLKTFISAFVSFSLAGWLWICFLSVVTVSGIFRRFTPLLLQINSLHGISCILSICDKSDSGSHRNLSHKFHIHPDSKVE